MADMPPARPVGTDDIEDLTGARISADSRQELLRDQTECTFSFLTEEGAPAAVVLSYVVHEGRFWFTSVEGRAQVRAVDRDPRACVAVSSSGTDLPGRRMLSLRGRAVVHRDRTAVAPILELLARRLAPAGVEDFLRLLHSPGRVVIELTPVSVVASHDSRRMAGDGRGRARGQS